MLCFLFIFFYAWSCRCLCMESMSVSSCRCCMFVSCVHHVAVLTNSYTCLRCFKIMDFQMLLEGGCPDSKLVAQQ